MTNIQMVAILSALEVDTEKNRLGEIFDLNNATGFLFSAVDAGYIKEEHGRCFFCMPSEKIESMTISTDMLVNLLSNLWEKKEPDESEVKLRITKMQATLGFPQETCIEILISIASNGEKCSALAMAMTVYKVASNLAFELISSSHRKMLFVRAVLGISRVEFTNGESTKSTLKIQHRALSLIDQANLSAEDALLMIYAGLNEHFCGSAEIGVGLREKGVRYLEQFNNPQIEDEEMSLIGYHYAELGKYEKTIACYESMITVLESQRDRGVIAFAYQPIIYGYIFLSEYHRALIMAQLLYNRAIESDNKNVAALMLSLIGRIYIYLGNMEKAETILYQAYAESSQLDYIWGLYYTILGMSYLHLKNKDYQAARESILLLNKIAKEHNVNPINASPFIYDIARAIENSNLPPLEDYDYLTVLKKGTKSVNVHMVGIAYRHLAQYEQRGNGKTDNIISYLTQSIKELIESGDGNELALTYLMLAHFYLESNDEESTQKYAQLAWDVQPEDEHQNFPNDLKHFVKMTNSKVSLSTLLETIWLECHYIISPERLVTRLLSAMCRALDVESGSFIEAKNSNFHALLSQNIEWDTSSPQKQRVLKTVSEVSKSRKVFMKFNRKASLGNKRLDISMQPMFMLCIPFFIDNTLGAVLYFESYYKYHALSEAEVELLVNFSQKISAHLFATLDYERISAEGGNVERNNEVRTRSGVCPSIDEAVLLIQAQISKVAKTNAPILITGETGVGKEIFCKQIFEDSGCCGAFVKVNCGAIPESLMESELFGYERGSFTGATQQKKGYFEVANNGTLFLDEIGELPLQMQVKLLRVLQEHELLRVGGTRAVKTNFRLISATNKNLQYEVEAGRFRKDLYYRLNVLQFEIPPLRERKSDITNMARFFVDKFCCELGRKPLNIEADVMDELLSYDWAGNIRELENVIQRAVLLAENDIISGNIITEGNSSIQANSMDRAEQILTLEDMERKYITAVLRKCNWKISGPGGAAKILGLKRTTLNFRMEKLGINKMNVE